MVLPVHESRGPEWPRWRRSLVWVLCLSLLCGGVWWFITRDFGEAFVAFGIPRLYALGCLATSLVWGVMNIQVMILVARLGRKSGARIGKTTVNRQSNGIVVDAPNQRP